MAPQGLRVFGFPVHVRPGFVVFLLLVVFLYGGSLGVWAAGAIAAFTLIHELGHAFAARATGARAEISLDFLAGYASYVPSRPLTRPERVGIAAAGPGAQLLVAVTVLAAMGVNPASYRSVVATEASMTIWWAGVGLALLNLLPVLPLDGGTIVATTLDAVVPGRGRAIMAWASLALTGVAIAAVVTNDSLRPFTFMVAVLGVMQLQQLSASRPPRLGGASGASLDQRDTAELARRAAYAEEQGWRTGKPGPFPAGVFPSPWFLAHRALAHGDPGTARRLLLDDLVAAQPSSWWPPETASADQLAPLVDLLPDPLPTGNRFSSQVLAGVLLRLGRHQRAAQHGAAEFTRSPSTGTALVVARSVAALGDHELAARWLHAAAGASSEPELLARAIDQAPELALVRHRPDVVALRQSLLGA
jgi:Zn-dependent protease